MPKQWVQPGSIDRSPMDIPTLNRKRPGAGDDAMTGGITDRLLRPQAVKQPVQAYEPQPVQRMNPNNRPVGNPENQRQNNFVPPPNFTPPVQQGPVNQPPLAIPQGPRTGGQGSWSPDSRPPVQPMPPPPPPQPMPLGPQTGQNPGTWTPQPQQSNIFRQIGQLGPQTGQNPGTWTPPQFQQPPPPPPPQQPNIFGQIGQVARPGQPPPPYYPQLQPQIQPQTMFQQGPQTGQGPGSWTPPQFMEQPQLPWQQRQQPTMFQGQYGAY